MHIICPIHARERMQQRNIRMEQIKSALNNPEITMTTHDKRRKRVIRKIGSKTLDVIYEPKSNNRIVLVTAAWLEENDRKVKG